MSDQSDKHNAEHLKQDLLDLTNEVADDDQAPIDQAAYDRTRARLLKASRKKTGLAECKQTGKPGPCPDPSKQKPKGNQGQGGEKAGADEPKKGILAKGKAAIAKAKAVAGKVGEKVGNLPGIKQVKGVMGATMGKVKEKLTQRYGSKTAAVILGGGFVGGYGVMAVSIATIGFSIPVVTDLVAMATLVPFAEAGRQLGIIKGAVESYLREAGLSSEELKALSQEAWSEIVQTVLDHIEANKGDLEAEAKAYLSSLSKDEVVEISQIAKELGAQ